VSPSEPSDETPSAPSGTTAVSVFGSSSPPPGSPEYERARAAGRRLAEAGFAVQTGGYGGVMAAACRGAVEAGGRAIGVTCARLEAWEPGRRTNPWVLEEVRYDDLRDRLLHLVERAAGVLVLPGGVGTLAELALAWNLALVGEAPPRPIVAAGPAWRRAVDALAEIGHLGPREQRLIAVHARVEDAVGALLAGLAGGHRGPASAT